MDQHEAQQHVFNSIITHLRKQGCQSLSARGTCAYHGSKGLMCAIGPLVVNYDSKFESHRPTAPLETSTVEVSTLLFRALTDEAQMAGGEFLRDAQISLHDSWRLDDLPFPEWLEKKAAAFAQSYELTIPNKE